MATTNPSLTTTYQRIVALGDDFLLTLPFANRQDVEVAIGDFTVYGDAYSGEVADLTALEAVEAPSNGDVYLVLDSWTFYAWDSSGDGAWVAGDTVDTVMGVQGHVLRGDRGESITRALIGPGMVFARAPTGATEVSLTAWTPA